MRARKHHAQICIFLHMPWLIALLHALPCADMMGIVPRVDLLHSLPEALLPSTQPLAVQAEGAHSGGPEQCAAHQLRLHAAAGASPMEVELAVEQALDRDEDAHMDVQPPGGASGGEGEEGGAGENVDSRGGAVPGGVAGVAGGQDERKGGPGGACGVAGEGDAVMQQQGAAQSGPQQQQPQQQPSSGPGNGAQAQGPQRARHVMQLYGFVLQRMPQPSHELMGPLAVPIYDATSTFEQHAAHDAPPCPWPMPPGPAPTLRTCPTPLPPCYGRPGAAASAAAGGCGVGPTGACAASGDAAVGAGGEGAYWGGEARLGEDGWAFHGCSAGPAFGRYGVSWLHPFGVLLHGVLPPAALPPFSIWMRGARHALVAVVHLGEVTLSDEEAAAAVVGHKVSGAGG